MLLDDPKKLLVVYLVFSFCTVLFSFLINGLFLKFSRTLGVKDQGDNLVRWSATSKPALGGISFYILFLFAIACYSLVFEAVSYMNDIVQFLGILGACSLGFVVGLADDAYNTKPFLKFFAQFTCAIILISTGTYINLSGFLWFDYAITILWVVGLMNSINMMDNMDGITTSISISIVLSGLYVLITNHEVKSIYFITLLGVLAGLIGFLYYNWNPSKMYMGDSGSQFLGVFLASIGILFFWNFNAAPNFRIQTRQFIIPMLIFIIPIIDTTTVTINRLLRGQSPFVGGRDHTTHHLSYLGLSDRQVALAFFGLSLLSLFFLMIIDKFIPRDKWDYQHFALFLVYFLVLFGGLYGITRRKRNRIKERPKNEN